MIKKIISGKIENVYDYYINKEKQEITFLNGRYAIKRFINNNQDQVSKNLFYSQKFDLKCFLFIIDGNMWIIDSKSNLIVIQENFMKENFYSNFFEFEQTISLDFIFYQQSKKQFLIISNQTLGVYQISIERNKQKEPAKKIFKLDKAVLDCKIHDNILILKQKDVFKIFNIQNWQILNLQIFNINLIDFSENNQYVYQQDNPFQKLRIYKQETLLKNQVLMDFVFFECQLFQDITHMTTYKDKYGLLFKKAYQKLIFIEFDINNKNFKLIFDINFQNQNIKKIKFIDNQSFFTKSNDKKIQFYQLQHQQKFDSNLLTKCIYKKSFINSLLEYDFFENIYCKFQIEFYFICLKANKYLKVIQQEFYQFKETPLSIKFFDIHQSEQNDQFKILNFVYNTKQYTIAQLIIIQNQEIIAEFSEKNILQQLVVNIDDNKQEFEILLLHNNNLTLEHGKIIKNENKNFELVCFSKFEFDFQIERIYYNKKQNHIYTLEYYQNQKQLVTYDIKEKGILSMIEGYLKRRKQIISIKIIQ